MAQVARIPSRQIMIKITIYGISFPQHKQALDSQKTMPTKLLLIAAVHNPLLFVLPYGDS